MATVIVEVKRQWMWSVFTCDNDIARVLVFFGWLTIYKLKPNCPDLSAMMDQVDKDLCALGVKTNGKGDNGTTTKHIL